jgi:hypothetical protein
VHKPENDDNPPASAVTGPRRVARLEEEIDELRQANNILKAVAGFLATSLREQDCSATDRDTSAPPGPHPY